MPEPPTNLIEVAFAANPFEAEAISGLLEAEGIESVQLKGSRGNQLATTGLTYGVFGRESRRVMVAAELAEKAAAIIARQLSENEE